MRINTTDAHAIPIGLLVVESLKPTAVNGHTLDDLRGSPQFPLLSQLLVDIVDCLTADVVQTTSSSA
jgi:hypothetical protein